MASTELTRTQTAGNRRKGTFSAWIKRSALAYNYLMSWNSTTSGTSLGDWIRFNGDRLDVLKYTGSIPYRVQTNRLFRDTSAWYHIVVAYDSEQSTASNRIKIYVNGVQETSFQSSTYPSQNYDFEFNNNNIIACVGKNYDTEANFDGSMSHVHWIDGTQYAASDFGETESTSGIWKPKTAPSVTYGTNGFFLKFQDSSSLGDDSSGNTNDFTLSGSGKQILDTPSNVFATFNPLAKHPSCGISFANGNTKITTTTSRGSVPSTLGFSSGKYYFEFDVVTAAQDGRWEIGIQPFANVEANDAVNSNNKMIGLSGYNGYVYYNGSSINNFYNTVGGFTSFTGIIGVAVDLDSSTKTIAFSRDGAWITGQAATDSNFSNALKVDITSSVANYDFWHFGVGTGNGSGTAGVGAANFGNGYFGTTAVSSAENDDAGYGKFEYDVPAGYYALCTKNINNYG